MRVLVAVAIVLSIGCGASRPRPMPLLPSGAQPFLAIEHVNQMGSSFEFIGLHVSVDGQEVLALDGDRALPPRLCVSRGRASPGAHDLRVEARYRGHGFGVFSYLSGYRFRSAASTRVEIPADAYGLTVRSEGFETGGATTPLEDRPQIRFVARAERSDPEGGCVPRVPGRAP